MIVLHCTDTKPSQDFTIGKLQASHKARGFGDYPGYHLYVRRDGTLYYCRPLSMRGCHVKGYNEHSIGVCYEGGHKDPPQPSLIGRGSTPGAAGLPPLRGAGRVSVYEDNRTPEQKEVLREVLRTLHEMYPKARICGHRDLNPNKACPCFDAQKEYPASNL